MLRDEVVGVGISKVEAWTGSPVSQQPSFYVLLLKRLREQAILSQENLKYKPHTNRRTEKQHTIAAALQAVSIRSSDTCRLEDLQVVGDPLEFHQPLEIKLFLAFQGFDILI